MNILFISHHFGLNGAERCLLSLLENIDRDTYHPTVILPGDGPLNNKIKRLGITTIIFPLSRWIQYPQETSCHPFNTIKERVIHLAQIINDENIDIIHTNSSVILEGALASRLTQKPHVWHIHEILKNHTSLKTVIPLDLTYKIIEVLSEKIIAVSGAVKNDLSTAIDSNKIEIIYNGTEGPPSSTQSGNLRKELNIPENGIIICTIGYLLNEKGYSTFIDAAIRVLTLIENVYFVSVGEIIDISLARALFKKIRTNSVNKYIKFLGYRNDIWDILKDADIYVCSSNTESFSLTVIEAMASGKPVITTCCGGPMEIVEHGRTGFHVPIGDADKMANAMLALVNDNTIRKEMGINGMIRVSQHFTSKIYCNSIESIYQQIMKQSIEAAGSENIMDWIGKLISDSEIDLRKKYPINNRIRRYRTKIIKLYNRFKKNYYTRLLKK